MSNNSLTIFEKTKRINEHQSEYWSARELSKILGYSEYRHFMPVIERAKVACINSHQAINDHFEDVLEMIELGKTASRELSDIKLLPTPEAIKESRKRIKKVIQKEIS